MCFPNFQKDTSLDIEKASLARWVANEYESLLFYVTSLKLFLHEHPHKEITTPTNNWRINYSESS